MRRWLPRILWLLAWSFWVWCGFGLARELPRDLGPVVCKLPLGDLESPNGFLGDESVIVTTRFKDDGKPFSYRLWDIETRTPKSEISVDFIGMGEFEDWVQPSIGFVVVEPKPSEDGKKSEGPLQAIDLRSGERHVLCSSPRRLYETAFHDHKPWMVAVNDEDPVQRCEVYDLKAGSVVFEWRPPQVQIARRVDIVNISWLPGTDSLLVAYWVTPVGFELTESHVIEIWDVAEKTRRSRHVLPDVFINSSKPAANGRIVLGHPLGRPTEFEVLDGLSGSVVLSNRTGSESLIDDDALQVIDTSGLSLSVDGNCLYLPSAIWNIDRRRLIWSGVEGLEDLKTKKAPNSFSVGEEWERWRFENRWLKPPWRIPDTWAVRSLRSGSVLYRVYDDHRVQLLHGNDHALAVHIIDGTIYNMLPVVNYSLLALCQTILALPLILLWAVLRWRRKRRLRLASVAA